MQKSHKNAKQTEDIRAAMIPYSFCSYLSFGVGIEWLKLCGV
jgi:hypothetical protein